MRDARPGRRDFVVALLPHSFRPGMAVQVAALPVLLLLLGPGLVLFVMARFYLQCRVHLVHGTLPVSSIVKREILRRISQRGDRLMALSPRRCRPELPSAKRRATIDR